MKRKKTLTPRHGGATWLRWKIRLHRPNDHPAAEDSMKMKLCLTQERLKELLIYAPETGRFYWRKQHGPVNAGSEAGNVRSTGYRLIGIDKHYHYEHRLAWLYVYGVHPTG